MTKLIVDVKIDSTNWLDLKNEDDWIIFFENIISAISLENKAEEVSVLLTNDDAIRILNNDYRSKDSPTNVLAFPSDDPITIGDIVLSYDTLQREALEQSKTFMDHLTHLFVHGYLHLLGFDHIEEDEQKIMETKEIEILHAMKIGNPYV